ncbi:hypothetical protein KEM55_008976, partial [Ascosphaera atra]
MDDVRHRLALATTVATQFDALSNNSAIAADAPTVALLARLRAEINYYVDHQFTTTPLPKPATFASPAATSASPAATPATPAATPASPVASPTSPVLSYASAASRQPASSPVSPPSASQWHTVQRRARHTTPQPEDPRLMVRLPRASVFRTRTAAQCLSVARRALGSAAPALRAVQCVPSGLALVPIDRTARAQLLSAASAVCSAFNATAVEEQT